jgi:hypothetical protein
MEEMRNAFKTFVGKYEWKRPLQRLGLAQSIILKLILGYKYADWIGSNSELS